MTARLRRSQQKAVEILAEKVGKPLTSSAADFWKDLEFAETLFRTRLDLESISDTRKKVTRVMPYARKLRNELLSLNGPKHVLESYGDLPKLIAELERFLAPQRSLYLASNTKVSGQVIRELSLNELSAFEWLVGKWLPPLFEKHFGMRATMRTSRDGIHSGPYLRFAQAYLRLIGIRNGAKQYRASSIAKGFKTASAGKSRRRGQSSEK